MINVLSYNFINIIYFNVDFKLLCKTWHCTFVNKIILTFYVIYPSKNTCQNVKKTETIQSACSRLLLLIIYIAFRWEERNTSKILSALCLSDVISVAGTIVILTVEAFASATWNLTYLYLFTYKRRLMPNIQVWPYNKNKQDAVFTFNLFQ
jgi:hypothetical protein